MFINLKGKRMNNQPPEKLRPPRDLKALPWILGLLVLAVIVIGYVVSQSGASSATPQTITFSGTGNHQTDYFTVPDNWTLDYSCLGFDSGAAGAMAVYVYGQGATLLAVPVNTACDLSGAINSTEMHQGGNIYLNVTATGQWSITIHTHP